MSSNWRSGRSSLIVALLDDERLWLIVALLAGGTVVVRYYMMHPYPAYATALFLHMAELLVENGYRRPETVPLYTDDGLPFAYPPLMFYVMAVLIDIGIDPIQLSRLLPGTLFVVTLIPYFYLSREFLSVRQAGFATVAIAVTPQLFRWHISGGGTVRAAGFLLVITGIYVGVRLFKTGDWRLIFPGMLLYGLTMLTHPVFMVYFGLSYLVFFVIFSRSLRGLLHGIVVATGGAIIGSPWWYYVSSTYGPETILNAATTHGGLGEGLGSAASAVAFLQNTGTQWEVGILTLLSLLGAFYALSRRRYEIPVWFVATAVVIPQPRFKIVAGMMLISALVVGEILPRVAEATATEGKSDSVLAVAFAALIVAMTSFGGIYVTDDPLHEERDSMPAYVDDDDIEAMHWVANETSPDAEFVVLGNQAEWFPYVAERTSLVGWWGAEWTPREQYEYHRSVHSELTRCTDEACVTETLEKNELEPDYLYIPSDESRPTDDTRTQGDELRATTIESERYQLAYENDGVMIFRVTK